MLRPSESDLLSSLAAEVLSASQSISVLTTGWDFHLTKGQHSALLIPDAHRSRSLRKVKRRYLLYQMIGEPFDIAYLGMFVPELEKQGWEVKILSFG